MKKKRRKNRKRTNKAIPAKGILRGMADRLWSYAIRDDWDWKCAACGNGKPDAHHMVPRGHETTRYDMFNGIALCPHCHQFDINKSPHMNAAGFLMWLESNWPKWHKWYMRYTENGYIPFHGTKNNSYYIDVIRGLKEYVPNEEYERIVGVRFAKWLADNE